MSALRTVRLETALSDRHVLARRVSSCFTREFSYFVGERSYPLARSLPFELATARIAVCAHTKIVQQCSLFFRPCWDALYHTQNRGSLFKSRCNMCSIKLSYVQTRLYSTVLVIGTNLLLACGRSKTNAYRASELQSAATGK